MFDEHNYAEDRKREHRIEAPRKSILTDWTEHQEMNIPWCSSERECVKRNRGIKTHDCRLRVLAIPRDWPTNPLNKETSTTSSPIPRDLNGVRETHSTCSARSPVTWATDRGETVQPVNVLPASIGYKRETLIVHEIQRLLPESLYNIVCHDIVSSHAYCPAKYWASDWVPLWIGKLASKPNPCLPVKRAVCNARCNPNQTTYKAHYDHKWPYMGKSDFDSGYIFF